jgi:hypothetical protein
MNKTSSSPFAAARLSNRETRKSILLAGAVAGALDIVFISLVWAPLGVSPPTILRVIASGLIGAPALSAGLGTALVGAALHFALSTVMAGLYCLYAPAGLRRYPWIAGPVYGAGLWLAMNLIVVPLSAAPVGAPPLPIGIADFAAHLFLVGLPIALFAQRSDRRAHKQAPHDGPRDKNDIDAAT